MVKVPRPVNVACVLLLASGLLFSSNGCTVNPATGQSQLALMSESQEIQMGRQANQDVLASYGLYPDDGWQEYIQRLGEDLASRSERPELPWQFRVVDDPIVNAFALPGGYIYITRGILAHFNSEAELVSVLGHEIGHVTARHSVEQMSRAQLANIGLGVAIAASEDFRPYAGLASQGLGLMFLKFGRDDEKQSDDLGLRYMLRAGYDPNEMPKVFNTLDRVSEAHGGGRIPAWASTHPNPDRRADRISDQIETLPVEQRQGAINRSSYLRRLDGITFGNNVREGYFIDNRFYHPEMAFRLDFPSGWKTTNQRTMVAAISPQEDAIVTLTLAGQETPAAATEAFFAKGNIERGSRWRQDFHLFRTVATNEQPQTLTGLVGFFEHNGLVLRLMSYTPSTLWEGYRQPMQQSLASFRRLTDRRHLDVEPARLEIVELDRQMTLQELDRKYPSTIEFKELAILNGVGEDALFDEGDLIKRVVGGELPES